MSKILIVYGTTEGQTAKIAWRIGDTLTELGLEVDVVDGQDLPGHFSLGGYAGVLVGASLHDGRYQSSIRDFAWRHHSELARIPSGFFSVSIAGAWPRAGLDTQLIERFFDETGWHPPMTARFAGAFLFSRYGHYPLSTRVAMEVVGWAMARRRRLVPNALGDYELTDWNAVTRFAQDFAASLAAAPTGALV